MEFDFTLYGDPGKRAAYRINASGLKVRLVGYANLYSVKNVSATGLLMARENSGAIIPRAGEKLILDLLIRDKVYLSSLNATVVRVDNGQVSLQFTDIDRRQEEAMDKLILELQKKLIKLTRKEQGQKRAT